MAHEQKGAEQEAGEQEHRFPVPAPIKQVSVHQAGEQEHNPVTLIVQGGAKVEVSQHSRPKQEQGHHVPGPAPMQCPTSGITA